MKCALIIILETDCPKNNENETNVERNEVMDQLPPPKEITQLIGLYLIFDPVFVITFSIIIIRSFLMLPQNLYILLRRTFYDKLNSKRNKITLLNFMLTLRPISSHFKIRLKNYFSVRGTISRWMFFLIFHYFFPIIATSISQNLQRGKMRKNVNQRN